MFTKQNDPILPPIIIFFAFPPQYMSQLNVVMHRKARAMYKYAHMHTIVCVAIYKSLQLCILFFKVDTLSLKEGWSLILGSVQFNAVSNVL